MSAKKFSTLAPCASLSGRFKCNDKSACDESDDHERFKRIDVVSPQSKATKRVISRENCSLLPAKRPLIFNRSEPLLSTVSTRTKTNFPMNVFFGRYRGISTRTQLEVLPRNLCPLINESRLLLVLVSKLILQADETNDKIKKSFTT